MAKRKRKPKKLEPITVHIRWMIRRDMPEVLVIEEAGDCEWTEQDFLRFLRNRNCMGMVAEVGQKVVGFMAYVLEKNRLDIAKMSVHPMCRLQAIGRQLADKLKSKLSPFRRTKLVCRVGESRVAGQLFLKAIGFKAERVVRSDDESTYIFVHRLGGDEDEPIQQNRISEYEECDHGGES